MGSLLFVIRFPHLFLPHLRGEDGRGHDSRLRAGILASLADRHYGVQARITAHVIY